MVRLDNVLIAAGSVWLGAWMASKHFLGGGFWLDGIAMGLLAAAGNLHNDIIDIKVDLVNRPDRPLPAGAVNLASVWLLTVLLSLAALSIGAARDRAHVFYFLSVAVILFIYNRVLKGWPLLGNLAVAALCASALALPMIDASLNYSQTKILLPLMVFSFLFTWVRELVKDIEDVDGDRRAGLHTLPIVIGSDACRVLARVLLTLANFVVAISVLAGWYPKSFFIFATLLVLPFSGLVFRALSHANPQWRKAQSNLKRAMLGGIVATIFTFLL